MVGVLAAGTDRSERVSAERPAVCAPGHERPHRRPPSVPRRRRSTTPPFGEHRGYGCGSQRRQRLVGTDSLHQRLQRRPVDAAAVRGQIPVNKKGLYRRPDRGDMCGGMGVLRLGKVDQGHHPEYPTVRPTGMAIDTPSDPA